MQCAQCCRDSCNHAFTHLLHITFTLMSNQQNRKNTIVLSHHIVSLSALHMAQPLHLPCPFQLVQYRPSKCKHKSIIHANLNAFAGGGSAEQIRRQLAERCNGAGAARDKDTMSVRPYVLCIAELMDYGWLMGIGPPNWSQNKQN